MQGSDTSNGGSGASPTDAARVAEIAGDEMWEPIAGFGGSYDVSSHGRVRSNERVVQARDGRSLRIASRVLSQGTTRKGYPNVSLHKHGVAYPREVHRLVCAAFHGQPEAGLEAAHLDGNKLNAHASNLAWKTRKENHADKRIHGTHLTGSDVPNAKLTADVARDICLRVTRGETCKGNARQLGITDRAVRKIRDGLLWADQTLAVRSYIQEQGK